MVQKIKTGMPKPIKHPAIGKQVQIIRKKVGSQPLKGLIRDVVAHSPATNLFLVAIPGHCPQHFSPAELSYRVIVWGSIIPYCTIDNC